MWGGGKGWGSSLQKETLQIYTLRLGYNRISILYIKKNKKNKMEEREIGMASSYWLLDSAPTLLSNAMQKKRQG